MASPTIAVAFGCLYFQVTDKAPKTFTGNDYLEWTEDALAHIGSVGSYEVDCRDAFGDAKFRVPENLDEVSEGRIRFPFHQFVSVSFDLYIPQQAQKSLLSETGHTFDSALGEKFEVRLRDGWQTGLAMVRAVDLQFADAADAAIILVREFLAREFDRMADLPVTLNWIGPTPAHFSARLQPEDELPGDFVRISRVRGGYDRYEFRCSSALGTPAQIAEAFFLRISHELDLLYRMALARSMHLELWNEAASDFQSILEAYRHDGWSGPFKRMRQGRKVSRALVSVAELELSQQESKQRFDQAFKSTYVIGAQGLIQEVIEDDLAELEPTPTGPLRSLLELFESSRRTRRDVMVAAISSLVGAVVAAAATLAAAG